MQKPPANARRCCCCRHDTDLICRSGQVTFEQSCGMQSACSLACSCWTSWHQDPDSLCHGSVQYTRRRQPPRSLSAPPHIQTADCRASSTCKLAYITHQTQLAITPEQHSKTCRTSSRFRPRSLPIVFSKHTLSRNVIRSHVLRPARTEHPCAQGHRPCPFSARCSPDHQLLCACCPFRTPQLTINCPAHCQ